MKIGTKLWHPCSLDIIEHKITGVRSYEDHTLYETKAVKPVGACGRIEVLLHQDKNNNLKFMDLISNHEHESGLQDFVEGHYYTSYTEARLEYYKIQELNSSISLDNKKRVYDSAKEQHDKIKLILKQIRLDLKEEQCK